MHWREPGEVQTEYRNRTKKEDFCDLNVAWLLCCAILIILENADLMGIFCPTTSNSFSHNNIKTVGSELGVSHMKAWIHPGLYTQFRCWWCIGAGGIFLGHFGLLSTN